MHPRAVLPLRLLCLLGLVWLLAGCVARAQAGVFQVIEEPPQDPNVAALRQRLDVQQSGAAAHPPV
jgi:hypothetical protein